MRSLRSAMSGSRFPFTTNAASEAITPAGRTLSLRDPVQEEPMKAIVFRGVGDVALESVPEQGSK